MKAHKNVMPSARGAECGDATNADDDTPVSNPPTRGGFPAVNAVTTTSSKGSDGLLGWINALAESHGAHGREYKASHVLGVRTELHDSQEQRKQSEEQPKHQREQMEAAVEKLEASHRGQMKERVEMLREGVEGGLRAKVEAELTAKLSFDMKKQLKAERTKLEEQL